MKSNSSFTLSAAAAGRRGAHSSVGSAMARELLPDGKIGKTSDHHYYEVCTSPVIYDLAAALKRTQALGLEITRA